jgi:hypothetical protein
MSKIFPKNFLVTIRTKMTEKIQKVEPPINPIGSAIFFCEPVMNVECVLTQSKVASYIIQNLYFYYSGILLMRKDENIIFPRTKQNV